MNFGLITDILTNESIGIIGINKETLELGYLTNSQELNEIMEVILDNEELELQIEEDFDGNKIIRREKVDLADSHYLIAFNYYLPSPWKVTKLIYKEGNLAESIEELYNDLIDNTEVE